MDTVEITVYSFEVLDGDGVHLMPFKATREAIESRYAGRVLEGTGEHVAQAVLDSRGGYQRQASGWTPQRLQQIQ